MEPLVLKVLQDLLDQLDHQDPLEPLVVLEHVEIPEQQEILARKVLPALKGQKVQQVYQEMWVLKETKDKQDHSVQLDHQVRKELLEVLVCQVHKETKDQLDQQERLEHLEILVLQVHKGNREPLDLQVHWDHKEVQVHRVQKVTPVLQVLLVQLEIPDLGAILERLGRLERKVQRETLVHQDQRDKEARLVLLEL